MDKREGPNDLPVVSVIISVYNSETFIGTTLASVWNQTFQSYEIIVVDDGSTDDTAGVLAPFQERIQYVYQHNQGVSAARNAGAKKARGKYLAFLDHDDLWGAQKLEKQVEAYERHPDAGFVFTEGVSFNHTGIINPGLSFNYLKEWICSNSSPKNISSTQVVIKGDLFHDLIQRNSVATSSAVIINTDLFRALGGFNTAIPIGEDYDLYLRLARNHPAVFIHCPLFFYRVSDLSLSGSLDERGNTWRTAAIQVLEGQIPLYPDEIKKLICLSLSQKYFETGYFYYDKGELNKAKKRFQRAWQLRKTDVRSLVYWLATWLLPDGVQKIRAVKQRRMPE